MHTFLCTSEVLVEVSKPVDRGLYNPFSFQTSWFGMAVSDLGMPSFNIQHPTCSLSVIFYSNSFIFDIQIAMVLQTLSQAELEKVTHAFISSCLHYCNSFYLGHSQKVHLPLSAHSKLICNPFNNFRKA